MVDAFADVIDDNDQGGEDTSTNDTDDSEIVTDSYVATDGVRTTLPDSDGNTDEKRYQDPDSDNQADDVDPRGLFRQATIDELRYYAREGPYGSAIIEKPIRDAFKHGYELIGDNTERSDGSSLASDFLDEYEDYYILAKIKSRRDGLCILMHQIKDGAESASDPIPSEGGSWDGFQLWTLDNLSDQLSTTKVAKYTEYEEDQLYISEGKEHGGVVVVDDISHTDHGDVVGYGIAPREESDDQSDVTFVHGDRCQHFVNGEHVDGDLGNDLTGQQIGESVLTPVLQPLKAAQMGFWSMMNILFKYSAPLHAVEPPESWSQDDFKVFNADLDDISMASDATLPPGASLNVAEGVSEFDPQPIYNTLIEAICAGTVFTKPVLQGTQTGTVSGSETDLKGYFNAVNLLRQQDIEKDFREALKMVSTYDQSAVPRVSGVEGIEFEWGPLFKVSDIEKAEGMVSVITAVTNGIKNYVLTPDQARSVVSEEWATFDVDVDLGDLTEDELDILDRINMNEAGQGVRDNENVNQENVRENPRQQNGGGQPPGQTRESSQPTRDSNLSELSEEELRAELKRRSNDE